MSSVIRIVCVISILIAGLFLVQGCGDSDSTATYDPETSVHPPDWLPAKHMFAARDNADVCRDCHGADLVGGGISKIGCTSCHLGGPLSVHPIEWGESAIEEHGLFVVQEGTSSCRNMWCHGAGLQGVPESGPSCNLCHPFAG
jgi:hypothetical protein